MTSEPMPKCDVVEEIVGGPVIQCVLGDNPNSAQWNDSLPYCRGESTTISKMNERFSSLLY